MINDNFTHILHLIKNDFTGWLYYVCGIVRYIGIGGTNIIIMLLYLLEGSHKMNVLY